MKIINLPRGGGKTTRLLYASEFNDAPIICSTHAQKQHLIDTANTLGLNIPEPIVISEITSGKFRGNNVMDKDILVDEAHWVLQALLKCLGMNGELKAITLTDEEGQIYELLFKQ